MTREVGVSRPARSALGKCGATRGKALHRLLGVRHPKGAINPLALKVLDAYG